MRVIVYIEVRFLWFEQSILIFILDILLKKFRIKYFTRSVSKANPNILYLCPPWLNLRFSLALTICEV